MGVLLPLRTPPASRLLRSNTILLRLLLLTTRKLPSPMPSTPSTKSTNPKFTVSTTNNNLSAPQFMDFTVNTKFLPILVFTDFTINDNLLPLKFLEFTNNTNKFSQELVVPTLCLLPVISVSVMPRLNLRLKLNTTGLNTMVNTTVPLPAPTLSPVILMLQLTPLGTPPPTTPLILLDIPASTTPLLLDIPAPTTLL